MMWGQGPGGWDEGVEGWVRGYGMDGCIRVLGGRIMVHWRDVNSPNLVVLGRQAGCCGLGRHAPQLATLPQWCCVSYDLYCLYICVGARCCQLHGNTSCHVGACRPGLGSAIRGKAARNLLIRCCGDMHSSSCSPTATSSSC